MTKGHDKAFRAALRLLEQDAPETVKSSVGIPRPTRQDVAIRVLKDALSAAAGALPSASSKPVLRTLHHLACTGGTLISKAVSAQPNVTLLSEVDPFSPMNYTRDSHFRPTDMIGLAKVGTRAASVETQTKLFKASLDILVQDNIDQNTYLILRDHSHGKYTYGKDIGPYPSLYALVREAYDLKSAVTVRDPIDSYLSLTANGWDTFSPASFDEYCRRMLIFLDDHADVPIIRYEDFVDDPQNTGAALCEVLHIPFNPDFVDLISAITLSGNSGRAGAHIQRRARRVIPDALTSEFNDSSHHPILANRLGYSTDLNASL